MRIALLGLAAACAAISMPAAAETSWSDHHGGGDRHRHHDGSGFTIHGGDGFVQPTDRIDLRRDNRRRDNSNLVLDSYGGEWALYNNRSWEPDSYNDWWNDRPDRAFPRWMQHNQDCSRQWYSGDTLRC